MMERLPNMKTTSHNMNPTSRYPTSTMVLFTALLGASAPASAQPVLDAERNYASISAGAGLTAGDLTHQLRLSAGTMPITLSGTTSMDRGRFMSFTIGRQMHDKPGADVPDPKRWRLEAQWWGGSLPRNRFRTGQLTVGLNDDVSVSGLYGHGLARLWRGDASQWWLGAGLGYARVSIPDATAASPGCGCLNGNSANGASLRLISTLERSLSESSSLFGTLMYTTLPKASTPANALPSVETQIPAALELGIGLRFTF